MSVSALNPKRARVESERGAPRSKAERTRAAILGEALQFLGERQFRDLSVSQLMAPLNVSRPTFYQYFADLHELMETLLRDLEQEIIAAADPWLEDAGDPVQSLSASLEAMVEACYEQGPVLRAVRDAASTDSWLDAAWNDFVGRFDDAVEARILLDQRRGLIPAMDARAVAMALNRLDAAYLIDAFGHPERQEKAPVLAALSRIWLSTLYPGSMQAEIDNKK